MFAQALFDARVAVVADRSSCEAAAQALFDARVAVVADRSSCEAAVPSGSVAHCKQWTCAKR